MFLKKGLSSDEDEETGAADVASFSTVAWREEVDTFGANLEIGAVNALALCRLLLQRYRVARNAAESLHMMACSKDLNALINVRLLVERS